MLARKYGIPKCAVLRILAKAGVERRSLSVALRKYAIDETFFDRIDNERKAYWLGFLLADGHIRHSGRFNRSGSVRVALQGRDVAHLEMLKSHIGSQKPIKLTTTNAGHPCCMLDLHSTRLANVLLSAGWTEFKEKGDCRILSTVPLRLRRHLVRGLVDGDGHFRSSPAYRWRNGRVSYQLHFEFVDLHLPIVQWVQQYLVRHCAMHRTKVYHPSKAYTIRYGGKQVTRILRHLYASAHVALERKVIKAHALLSAASPSPQIRSRSTDKSAPL